jgi:5-methylcytosine-specific restriction endonuclease McrA
MARWELYVEYLFKCEYCRLDGTTQGAWWIFTDDHIVPIELGGTDIPLNLALACSGCNSTKKHFDPTEGGRDPLTPESRGRLIEKARQYVARMRARQSEDFRRLVLDKLT